MQRRLKVLAIFGLILVLTILPSCIASPKTPSIYSDGLLLPMSESTNQSVYCADCAQATLSALQTLEKSSGDNQAAATAAIMRANAQATLDAVSSTLSAAQTQEKNNANIIAAQVAATAEIARAQAQATLVSAGETQSAAQTQDSIRQTQAQSILQVTAEMATRSANAMLIQQNNAILAARTQTAVANNIATQTQSAIATNAWYADQSRQRENQRWEQFSFIWMLCLPLFLISVMVILILFFWRWMKIRETQQLLDMEARADPPLIIDHENRSDRIYQAGSNQAPSPPDHVGKWLDEVKRKLLADKKDHDDHTDS